MTVGFWTMAIVVDGEGLRDDFEVNGGLRLGLASGFFWWIFREGIVVTES